MPPLHGQPRSSPPGGLLVRAWQAPLLPGFCPCSSLLAQPHGVCGPCKVPAAGRLEARKPSPSQVRPAPSERARPGLTPIQGAEGAFRATLALTTMYFHGLGNEFPGGRLGMWVKVPQGSSGGGSRPWASASTVGRGAGLPPPLFPRAEPRAWEPPPSSHSRLGLLRLLLPWLNVPPARRPPWSWLMGGGFVW